MKKGYTEVRHLVGVIYERKARGKINREIAESFGLTLKHRVIECFRDKYPIEAMCELFKMSRSEYYDWRKWQ